MEQTKKVKGMMYAVAAGTLWGITGPLGQYLFENKGITAEWLVPYRLTISGLILLLYLYTKMKKDIFQVFRDKKDRIRMIIYSIFGMMMVQYSFFASVEASNGGTASVLQYTCPAMMILYFLIFKKKRPSKRETLSVIFVLVGVFLLSTNGNLHTLVITPKALFFGLLCAFFSCLYSMLPEKLLEKYSGALVCGWAMFIGGIVMLLLIRPWQMSVVPDTKAVMLLAVLIIAGTVFPFSFALCALPFIGPVYTNVFCSIEPVVASIVTFFVLGTRFGRIEVVGFGLIIFTVYMLAFEQKDEENQGLQPSVDEFLS